MSLKDPSKKWKGKRNEQTVTVILGREDRHYKQEGITRGKIEP